MSDKELWLTQYVPLRYNMRTISNNGVTEHPVNNIAKEVENLMDVRSMIIYGHEGTGKSTSLYHLANMWKNESSGFSQTFSYVFLLPIREIKNPTSDLEQIVCSDLQLVPKEQEQAVRRFIKFNPSAILWQRPVFAGNTSLYLTCLVYSFIQKYNKIKSFMSTMNK